MKKRIMLFTLLLAFSAQCLQAQGGQVCPMDEQCSPDPPPDPPPPPPDPTPAPPLLNGVPWLDPSTASTVSGAPSGAHLTYFGGPVISNVHVVQVLYGSGNFLPQVSSPAAPSIGSFFSDILGANSGYISLLTQYNTTTSGGTNQTIGNGTFDGLLQIVPSAANNGSTIDDSNIQAELLAQISAGHLPLPVLDAAGNVNTVYMIYFPPGKTITQGGSSSCVEGGFCAYHGTTSKTFNSRNLLYGVFPDMQSGGCSVGCGRSTTFGNYTSVSSHELTEAITDADVGIATTFAPPLAWYDMQHGEIGDICNAQQGSYSANGTTYTIQLEFSNAANNCVLPVPVNFALSASPASLNVTQGDSGSTTITVTPSGGFTGNVSLSASGLPAGVTASFGANPTASSSNVTLTANVTATAGAATVTITGTSGALTNTTTLPLNIVALASPTSGPAPLTVSFYGGARQSLPLDHWDFGDGQTSSGQIAPIVHTYQAAGTYTATPFYRGATEVTRTVPPHVIVHLVAGPPVTISVL